MPLPLLHTQLSTTVASYLAVDLEEFQEEAGNDARDTNEQVDDNEEDVSSAWLSEYK